MSAGALAYVLNLPGLTNAEFRAMVHIANGRSRVATVAGRIDTWPPAKAQRIIDRLVRKGLVTVDEYGDIEIVDRPLPIRV